MSFNLLFSKDIFDARTKSNFTQQKTAERVGLSIRQYQNIESGRAIPKTETFLKLVYLFDLDINNYREVITADDSVSSR